MERWPLKLVGCSLCLIFITALYVKTPTLASLGIGSRMSDPGATDCKSVAIRPETFLYLSMGPSKPKSFIHDRSCFKNSALLFLTFKERVKAAGPRKGCSYFTAHFPNSTWTTGRNELLRQACLLEARQGWRFEFFIFTDNDVQLKGTSPSIDGEDLFRHLLLKYRPLRASVQFRYITLPPIDSRIPKCARVCYTDAAVDAYHRTGVELVLPWRTVFDDVSWYMSAYMVNLLLGAMAPAYCHVYRQITIEEKLTHGGVYPKGSDQGMDYGPEWVNARRLVIELLVKAGVPGFSTATTERGLLKKLSGGLFGRMTRAGFEEKCVAQKEGVNYSSLIQYRVPYM